MRSRRFSDQCARCWQRAVRCLCQVEAPIAARTKVLVVMQWAEWRRGTNTGRLVPLVLTNGEVWRRGDPDIASVSCLLRTEERPAVVLYPAPDSVPLTEWIEQNGLPRTLVVPDGTWGKAGKARRREPAFANLPTVRVGIGHEESRYRLRKSPGLARFGTAEAVARALRDIGEPEPAAKLERIFVRLVEETLAARRGMPL